MPSIHIPEEPFSTLVEEYGYEGAKERIKGLARNAASEVSVGVETSQ